jgi:hypothetical protein
VQSSLESFQLADRFGQLSELIAGTVQLGKTCQLVNRFGQRSDLIVSEPIVGTYQIGEMSVRCMIDSGSKASRLEGQPRKVRFVSWSIVKQIDSGSEVS